MMEHDRSEREARLTRLLSFLHVDPKNAALLADIAGLQWSLGQIEEARRHAGEALFIDAQNRAAHAVLGLIAARASAYEQVVLHLEIALGGEESSSLLSYYYAHALAMLGDFVRAEAPAQFSVQAQNVPAHAPALYIRILHYLGKIEEAIAYAETLGEQLPPQVGGMLSTLYFDQEDLEKARDVAAATLKENGDDADALTTTGLLALGDMDARLAQADFERVLRRQPEHGRALLGQGMSQLLAGDLPAATETLERATHTTNMAEHIGTWQILAWCHILQKNSAAAYQALQRALELDRNFAETHGGLAIVALMRGNLDSAIQSAKRATQLDRNNFSGHFAQSLIQQISGNPGRAQAIMEHLLTQPILPDGKTIQAAVAEMLIKSNSSMGNKPTLH